MKILHVLNIVKRRYKAPRRIPLACGPQPLTGFRQEAAATVSSRNARNVMAGRIAALFGLLMLTFLCACAPPQRGSDSTARPEPDLPALNRANPGYMQWLEKQSMLNEAREMADIVSGTHIQWRSQFTTPHPAALRNEASVWLALNPASVITNGKQPLFIHIQHPEFWRQATMLGIRGLYINPVRESGGVWGYELAETATAGQDSVRYSFSKHVGTEQDYRQLINTANRHGAILAADSIPMATGLGADFFLGARGHHDYLGGYYVIELPRDLWALLPETESRWQGAVLNEDIINQLRQQKILPEPLLREISGYPLTGTGWAVTGEIAGMDGNTRRFAYLYCGSAHRPVLAWTDPGAVARRILSGSIIKDIGTRGTALSGISVAPLIGLEPASEKQVQWSKQTGTRPLVAPQTLAATAQEAAETIARETRRYGGWTLITDYLPMPILRDMLVNGPDFAIDHYTSIAAQYSLLSGDATLLRQTMGAMQALGIDASRLMHGIQTQEYIDTSLLHLYGAPEGATREAVTQLRNTASALFLSRLTSNGGDVFINGERLYLTPAGFTAVAAGVRNLQKPSIVQKQMIRRGMTALGLFHAMQPGLLRLSGKELAGTLPLQEGLVPATGARSALSQNVLGSYDLSGTEAGTLLSPLSMPRAKTAFADVPVQLLTPFSFADTMRRAIQVRNRLRLQDARILGQLPVSGQGSVLQLIAPPDNSGLILLATNFSRTSVTETVTSQQIPPLKPFAGNSQITDLLPVSTQDEMFLESNGISDELTGLSHPMPFIAEHDAQPSSTQPAETPQTKTPAPTEWQGQALTITLEPWQTRALFFELEPDDK